MLMHGTAVSLGLLHQKRSWGKRVWRAGGDADWNAAGDSGAIGEFGTINQSTNQPMFLSLSLSRALSLSRLSIYIYTRAHACISYIYIWLYMHIYNIYNAHTRMLFLINYLYSQPPWGGAMVREIVKHQQTTKHGERPSKRNEFVSWCVCKKGFDPGTRNNGELTRINHQPWHICRKEP